MPIGFNGRGPLILIADDDETERFLQRQVLEPAGFEIVEAKNGGEALEGFNERGPISSSSM
jgi:CheY-like chemotaxis protein